MAFEAVGAAVVGAEVFDVFVGAVVGLAVGAHVAEQFEPSTSAGHTKPPVAISYIATALYSYGLIYLWSYGVMALYRAHEAAGPKLLYSYGLM